jgi:hypothetical protein
MPRFSEIGDPGAVENLYADKIIVYVEGEVDASIYYEIAGSNIRGSLEFKEPRIGGSGSDAVIAQVRAERPANPKVFGLVDGEAAAKVGAVDKLLACTDVFFQIDDDPAVTGILFLGQHEMENLLVANGDLPDVILRDLDPRYVGQITPDQIEKSIGEATRIFFFAALLKYASMTLHHLSRTAGGNGCRTLDSSRFLDRRPFKVVLREIRAQVDVDRDVTWGKLRREIRRTREEFASRLKASRADASEIARETMRVADGKSLLTLLKRKYSPGGRWESHLATALAGTSFASAFRDDLLAITA